ncbi:ribonuclease BN [Streptomyces sp. BI20]|uniref:ribonuclease BN n=1 Tax=Streptomyces sp. BI20 TaxID=3403460 RepID=UPI003C766577
MASDSRSLSARLRSSPAATLWRRGRHVELMHRAMGFAALGFLTLVPLLIVVAGAVPGTGESFGRWLGQALGVTEPSRIRVESLFGAGNEALERTTAFGLAALTVFGLTFGGAVQTGYERIWDLPPARWHTLWRHVVWLALVIGWLGVLVLVPGTVWGAGVDLLLTVGFFWGSQWLLLAGRVRWRALFPGAVATAVGLLGLRVFSQLVFSPLIASSAVTYGPFGTLLAVQSWLVGVGFVVHGGALVGRLLAARRPG